MPLLMKLLLDQTAGLLRLQPSTAEESDRFWIQVWGQKAPLRYLGSSQIVARQNCGTPNCGMPKPLDLE